MAAFMSRFLILNGIGAAALLSAGMIGLLRQPFTGANAVVCWSILAMLGVGLWFCARTRWTHVLWIAKHVVRLGLLGTVAGLIVAFGAVKGGAIAEADIPNLIGQVVDGMYVSLYATFAGITANLWLKINLKLLADRDG